MHKTSPVPLPDRDLMLQSVDALYREVARLRFAMEQQQRQLKSMAVEMLLLGHWKPKEHINSLLGFSESCYLVGNYDFREYRPLGTEENPEMAARKDRVFTLLQKSLGPEFPCFYCESEFGLNTLLINTAALNRRAEDQLLVRANHFLELAQEEMSMTLSLCLSSSCEGVDQLPDALAQVRRLWTLQHKVPGCRRILYGGRLELNAEVSELDREELARQIQQAAQKCDIPSLHRAVSNLTLLEYRDRGSIPLVHDGLERELDSINRALGLQKRGLNLLVRIKQDMKTANTMDELLILLNEYFSNADLHLRSIAGQQKSVETAMLPEQIKAYIDVHLVDSGLNLTTLAQTFQVHHERISKSFKSAYGIGVLSYIQQHRVETAKNLIEQGVPVPEAEAKAGFSTRRSFDRVFRQYAGCTPAQYRAQHTIIG